MKRCYRCGTEWRKERRPSQKDFCEKCNAYIHCCLNCKFHDEHVHNQCRIPNTEWVGDVEKGNFCDEFVFADRPAGNSRSEEEGQARKAFDQLFGEAD